MRPRRRQRRHRLEEELACLQAHRLGRIKRRELTPGSERERLFDLALGAGRPVRWPDYMVSAALFRAELALMDPPPVAAQQGETI